MQDGEQVTRVHVEGLWVRFGEVAAVRGIDVTEDAQQNFHWDGVYWMSAK